MGKYMIIVFAALLLLGFYLIIKLRRIMSFCRSHIRMKTARFVALTIALLVIIYCIMKEEMAILFILHFTIASVVLDILLWCEQIIEKAIRKQKKEERKINAAVRRLCGCGLLPFVISVAIFGYGYYNMAHIVRTDYTIETGLIQEEGYRILLITDTHYGTIQDTKLLKDRVQEFNRLEADLVILGGDMTEEGTSKAAMEELFQVLGQIESRYGIYYVYGNHDKQTYSGNPSYTQAELEQTITKNGIVILEDEMVEIGEELILAGRVDASWSRRAERKSMEEILDRADKSRYIIVADHQPVMADENDAAGVDLMLSGHMHAGQIWPTGIINTLKGNLNYGFFEEGDCDIIVSSGFAGWGFPIRTQGHSEYAVINLVKSENSD